MKIYEKKDERINKKRVLLTVFVLVCILGGFRRFPGAKEKNEIIFGIAQNPLITLTSFGGKGAADMRDIFQSTADEIKQRYGYTLNLKIYSAPKFLYKAIEDRQADFSGTVLAVYLSAKNAGVPVKPLLYPSPTGTKGNKYCVYVHKNSGVKNIKLLRGKTFAADFPVFDSKKDALPPSESYIYWAAVKKILLNNGVNNLFKDFFKEFKVVPAPHESVAYSVLLGKFDAFYAGEDYIQTLKNYDAAFSNLMALSCLRFPVGAPIVYRSDLDPKVVNMFKDFMMSGKKGAPAGNVIQKEFKGIRFFTADEKDYEPYFALLEEAKKKGWLEEFTGIMKTTEKPGEKKGKSKLYESK